MMKTQQRLLWVGWILAVLAAAGCDDEEPDTCDRPSPGFLQEWLFVPLPEVPFVVLGQGEPCWMNKCFPSKPEFQIKNHYAVEDDYDRRRCRSDLFCHQELGCQPRMRM